MPDTENDNVGHSSHLLTTSSNLLGLCFIVLTSLHVLHLAQASIIDEFTAVAIVLLMASSLLSFLALRSKTKRGLFYEKVADGFFLCGLISVFITTMLIAFGVIR